MGMESLKISEFVQWRAWCVLQHSHHNISVSQAGDEKTATQLNKTHFSFAEILLKNHLRKLFANTAVSTVLAHKENYILQSDTGQPYFPSLNFSRYSCQC